jgi:hypothetical protein
MPAPSLNDHNRRLSVLEDHAADTLRVMNALADVGRTVSSISFSRNAASISKLSTL